MNFNRISMTIDKLENISNNNDVESLSNILKKPSSNEKYEIFKFFCIKGNMNMIENIHNRIHDYDKTYFEHHINDIFMHSVNNNQLEVVKWLFQHYPNIDINVCNGHAYKIAIKNNYMDIIEWFNNELNCMNQI